MWGWALYDWGNSAFATTVMAGFFPIFFKQYWSYGTDVNVSTAQLGFGNAIASLLVALMAPLLGSIADSGSARKTFLIFFAYLGVLMTAVLFFIPKGHWALAIFVYSTGIIGFSGSIIFYDALLPTVASERDVDFVSSLGYALGYLGGGILFLINVLMTLMPDKFGISSSAAAVRWSFVSVAIWWGVFTLFTIAWVKEGKTSTAMSNGYGVIKRGLQQFIQTFRQIRHLKMIFLFLAAYWFYIDGVDTIIRMAVDYGLSLGFEANDLIIALLIVQFVGFPAALGFGVLGRKWGVRKSIFFAIGVYIAITLWGTQMSTKYEFYGLAIVIGLVQGGIQALSRSYYSRMIPPNRTAEFFGFYNMLGKFAAIFGPALMGGVGLLAKRLLMPAVPDPEQMVYYGRLASRWSIGSIVLLFIIGAVLLYFVDEDRGKLESARLT